MKYKLSYNFSELKSESDYIIFSADPLCGELRTI